MGSIFPEISLKFCNACYWVSCSYETHSSSGAAGTHVPSWPKPVPALMVQTSMQNSTMFLKRGNGGFPLSNQLQLKKKKSVHNHWLFNVQLKKKVVRQII